MTPPPPAEPDLWRHANFLRLWSAQAISAFGSRITRTALPIIAVATLHASESTIGVLAAMQLVPGLILAIMAGGLVDRGRKRRILIAADLIRGALVTSLTLAWALGALSMVQVILVGAGVGAASALFQITDVAYLPQLIGRRRLAEGNAKLETTEAVAEITGPASAGVLIAALGAPLAVAIDAASYVWSAIMLDRIRGDEADAHDGATSPRSASPLPPPPSPPSPSPPLSSPPLSSPPLSPSGVAPGDDAEPEAAALRTGADFQIGMRAVFGHPQVRPILLALMMWSVTGGFFIALYTPFCLRALALPESTFGVVIAMGGVGSLGGAVLARWLARAIGVGRTLILASSLSLAFTLFIPIAASVSSHTLAVGFLIAHQLIGDGMSVAFIVLAVTLRQTVLPRAVLGRANAAVYVSTTAVLVVASVLAGSVAAWLDIRTAVWIGFAIGLTAPVFLWPLRRLRDMPAGDLSAPTTARAAT